MYNYQQNYVFTHYSCPCTLNWGWRKYLNKQTQKIHTWHLSTTSYTTILRPTTKQHISWMCAACFRESKVTTLVRWDLKNRTNSLSNHSVRKRRHSFFFMSHANINKVQNYVHNLLWFTPTVTHIWSAALKARCAWTCGTF